MISVDTIYQRVLAATNKEQRGYITPQEFNLFANQAQMDIFDQYFYDVDKFSRVHGNETEASDMLDLLNEKIDIFEMKEVPLIQPIAPITTWTLPSPPANPEIYILGNIMHGDATIGFREVERVSEKELMTILQSPLTRPRADRPIYTHQGLGAGGNQVRVWGRFDAAGDFVPIDTLITCNYTRRPVNANWNFVVVNGYAQYNATDSTNFELHPSEENNLVHKILELAGIVMKDANLYQIASQEEIKDIQQEKQ